MSTVEKSIEVDVPVHVAYSQWTQFEEFPQFMEGVEEVRQLDDKHLHWRAEIAGKDKEWDAEITEQVPDQCIAWHSTSGAENGGMVTFEPMGSGRTRVNLRMDYDPQGFLENVGDVLGLVSMRVRGDLERFKDFVEQRGTPTGRWEGEIHQGQVESGSGATGGPRVYDTSGDYSGSGTAGNPTGRPSDIGSDVASGRTGGYGGTGRSNPDSGSPDDLSARQGNLPGMGSSSSGAARGTSGLGSDVTGALDLGATHPDQSDFNRGGLTGAEDLGAASDYDALRGTPGDRSTSGGNTLDSGAGSDIPESSRGAGSGLTGNASQGLSGGGLTSEEELRRRKLAEQQGSQKGKGSKMP